MQVIDVCLPSQTAVVYSKEDIFLHLTILLKACVDIVESENFSIGRKRKKKKILPLHSCR